MENRFGVKDFILLLLIVALIVSVWLAMKQYDRQYDQILAIRRQLDDTTQSVRQIQRRLDSGIALSGGTTRPAVATDAGPFARIAAARAKPDFAEGDWLVEGLSGRLATITPLVSGDASASAVQRNVLQSLIDRDPVTLEWSGLLAESWTVEDNVKAWQAYVDQRKQVPLTEEEILQEADLPPADKAEERREYIEKRLAEGRRDEQIGAEPETPPAIVITFTMRDGITFSDGEPLTADDVVWTYDWLMNEAVNAPRHRAYYKTIRSVTKKGDNQVVFEFREPYFESLAVAGSLEVLPRHFYSKFDPETFNKTPGLLMGSGPYKLADPQGWRPGQPLELVRNDRYWGIAPAFDKIVYREFTNDVARQTEFRNGNIDTFGAFPEQYEEMRRDPELASRTQHFAYTNPIGGYRYIAWNQIRNGKPSAFADKRVRQAMTLLIDRQRLVDEVMRGLATISTGPFNPLSKQSNPDIKPWGYDPERAAQLLAEAGFTDPNKEGILRGPDGRPFEFRLTYPSGNANYERMALSLKDMLARGKIKLNPDPQEWSVFTQRLENKDFDAITLAWTAGIETDIYQMFHSSQTVAGGDNFMNYRSPALDAIIEKARRTVDEDERIPMWRKAHEILHEEQPYTFLFFPKSLVFIHGRIANVQLLPRGLNPREEWYVPLERQKYSR